MNRRYRFALAAAITFSVLSLYDALHHGITGRGSVFSDEHGSTWGTIAISVVAALSFAALAVVLVDARAQVDHGSGFRAWIRRLLTVDLALLAVVFAVGAPFFDDPGNGVAALLTPVAGVGFAGMFLLAFALGLALVRRPELRTSALLLVAVVPVVGLTVALQLLAPTYAHPAYAETVVYLGLARLGRPPRRGSARTSIVTAPQPATR